MTERKKIEGIGGWLIVIAIGMILQPLIIMALSFPTYLEIFSTGIWEVLTSPESEAYNVLWGPLLISEVVINIGIVISFAILNFLFYTKSSRFPLMFIGLQTFILVFMLVDNWVVSLILPEEPIFNAEYAKEFLRQLLYVLIWTPYMLKGERVKETFVNNSKKNQTINEQYQKTMA